MCKKEIILLAKSAKCHNFCIAGIDCLTGDWIRIISNDDSIQNSITEDDMRYNDGTLPSLFDVIRIECFNKSPSFHQPENYLMDNSYYWHKVRNSAIDEVLKLHPCENKDFLFYNTDNKVDSSVLNKVHDSEKYSLILIKPQNVVISVKKWPDKFEKAIKAIFQYNGQKYSYIAIKDHDVSNKYQSYNDGYYDLNDDMYFVMSLGDTHKDGKNYKIIATII